MIDDDAGGREASVKIFDELVLDGTSYEHKNGGARVYLCVCDGFGCGCWALFRGLRFALRVGDGR
jgi:hypothetical protein